MNPHFHYHFKEQHLWLLAEKAIFWEEEKALIISDLHLGKTGPFRKSGIAVPQHVFMQDMQQLVTLIQSYKPTQLIVVGDFFHSEENKELDLFLKWRRDFASLDIKLIQGNHDILKDEWYKDAFVQVYKKESYIQGPFAFVHDQKDMEKYPAFSDKYFFTGHTHPGIFIKGTGKQSLRFPCFYFKESHAVLPAFGRFTGLAMIKPGKRDKVFPIIASTAAKQEFGKVIAL